MSYIDGARTNGLGLPSEMLKYAEVPQWWYLAVFLVSLGVGIGCSVSAFAIAVVLMS